MTNYWDPSGEVPSIQNANFRAWIGQSEKWQWILGPKLCTAGQYAGAVADALADYIDHRLDSA